MDLGGEIRSTLPSWLGFRFGRDERDADFGGDTGHGTCDFLSGGGGGGGQQRF